MRISSHIAQYESILNAIKDERASKLGLLKHNFFSTYALLRIVKKISNKILIEIEF